MRDARMGVVRVVPDLASQSLAAARVFYGEVLGLEVVMDLGGTVALTDRPSWVRVPG